MPPFSYITDLPPQVREALDVGLQQVFLDAFNQSMTITANEAQAYQDAWMKVFQAAFPGQVASIPQMSPLPSSALKEQAMGYWVDLAGVQFEEEGMSWIQAFPYGEYSHPRYGKIRMDHMKAAEMAVNIKSKVRGADLDIDYDHKEYSGRAAGWVRDAEARTDGLWLAVQWTPDALQALKKGEYRYFSPEYNETWTDPKTGKKYRNVLFGGAVTNRPFLRDILPINLSEVFQKEGGNRLNEEQLKEMRKLLGLPEDATVDQVMEAMRAKAAETTEPAATEGGTTEAGAPAGGAPATPPTSAPTPATTTGTPAAGNTGLSEAEKADLLKLSEDSPVVKKLAERLVAVETGARLSEINIKLAELSTPNGSKWAIPPVTHEEMRKLLMEVTPEQGEKFVKVLAKLKETGLVELSEKGKARTDSGSGDAVTEFDNRIKKLQEEDKNLSYADAALKAADQDPQLFNEVREASWLREGVK